MCKVKLQRVIIYVHKLIYIISLIHMSFRTVNMRSKSVSRVLHVWITKALSMLLHYHWFKWFNRLLRRMLFQMKSLLTLILTYYFLHIARSSNIYNVDHMMPGAFASRVSAVSTINILNLFSFLHLRTWSVGLISELTMWKYLSNHPMECGQSNSLFIVSTVKHN